MSKQKRLYTTFQNMSKIFNGAWNVSNGIANTEPTPQPNDVVYKTDDPAEYQSKMLELQQNKYLQNRWVRANQNLSMSAFAGLSNLKLMYRDADLMDSYPEIGAALDIISEESVLTSGSRSGMVVNVSSKSDRIKSILEDLFVNRLNLQVTAQMVMRAMVKYGNQFMLLDIDKNLGVKGWRQLPVAEVERIENGIINPYGGQNSISMATGNADDADMSTKFIWTNENGGTLTPFRNWQIAHFRLLHNSMFLPYGCLVGDTRVETEFGYKEIKDIEIGDNVWTFNVDTQKRELACVTMHMNKGVKDVFEVRTFHNQIEGTSDHKLLCYDNNSLVYKEIKDINVGDLLVVDNSINKQEKKIKIDKSFPTKNEVSLYRATGWWNKNIEFIPEYVDEKFARFFGFMIGDGWIVNNKSVSFAVGEYDLFNKEFSDYLEEITNKKVKWARHPKRKTNTTGGYVCAYVYSKTLSLILHRMGFNGKFNEKRIPSWLYSCSDSIKKSFLNGLMTADGAYNIDKYGVLRCSLELGNEQLIKDVKILVQSLGYKSSKISHRRRLNTISQKMGNNKIKDFSESYYFYYYESFNKQEKKYDLVDRIENGFKTEKVRCKEYAGKKTTYDITVSNKNSNFFANGIVTHNCSALLAARRHFRMLALMEDMMLIYRLERSMERRVYKIFVGSLDDKDIPGFVEQIANQFKRAPIIDPLTGQLDLRKNILPVWKKTPIPLLDGRTISIEELAKEFDEGKTNYVYSIQDKTHKIVPGKVVWCGKNYTAEQLYKITLDDDSYMVMAGEHEIIMRDGSKKRADEVVTGESVMPFYRKNTKDEQVYNPHSGKYEYTHDLINGSDKENVQEECDIVGVEKSRKIKCVEIIGGDDVYCMTVVGDKGEEDRHNFAIRTFNPLKASLEPINVSGCFISNCASDDVFIPTRNENLTNPIETLAGAKNLDAIDDIKYIQKKVCAALRIPQSFLNFEETQGDGKGLALMDVRFARTINRYQQAFLMELTKVATIHLYLLGFEDDLTNFSLTMNNPSTQAEQLELENLGKKIQTVRDAVSDPGNGIPAMSLQRALKEIMKWSDKDIKENFEEIRLEKALAAEYEKTAQIIKRTGIFDTVDRIYGEPGAEYQEEQGGGQEGGPDGGTMGGGGFGGGLDDFGAPGGDEGLEVGGEEGSEPVQDMGGEQPGGNEAPSSEGMPMESRKLKKPLITEEKKKKVIDIQNRHTNQIFSRLVENMESKEHEDEIPTRVDVYDKSLMISEEFHNMFNKLDEFKK